MKKILLALLIALVFSPLASHAATSCVLDPSVCTGTTFCGTDGTCQAPTTPTTPPGTTPPGTNPPAVTNTNGFIPLSDIPAIQTAAGTDGLAAFLQQLYLICIGIAVVLAVLQLIRAGITYSMSDAITSKEEAKHLISASLLGLLLVLSPYLVFSIINPEIRTLKINTSTLNSPPASPSGTNTGPADHPNPTSFTYNNSNYYLCDQQSCDAQSQKCTSTGGSPNHVCRDNQSGTITETSWLQGITAPDQCPSGSYNYIECPIPSTGGGGGF